jgi:hypothetical protein
MGTGSSFARRHGSAKAPTNIGALPRKGALPGRAELDHLAMGELRNAKRPGSRLGSSGRQHFASGCPAWRAMWSGLGPEVVSKALWKELSAYRRGVPIQGSSTRPNRGFASMSTSLRLPQTCGPLAERNPAPNQRTFAASRRPFVASQIGPFRGLRQEFPICGKGQVGTAGRAGIARRHSRIHAKGAAASCREQVDRGAWRHLSSPAGPG